MHIYIHVSQLRGHTDPSTWSADSRRRCRVVAGSQSPPRAMRQLTDACNPTRGYECSATASTL